MSIRVDGLQEAIKDFKKVDGDINDLKDAFQAIGMDVVNEAKSLAPVRTGALRQRIKAGRRQNGVVISSGGTFYHAFQHFGTKYIKANPYLFQAIDRQEAHIIKSFEDNVERVLREVFN